MKRTIVLIAMAAVIASCGGNDNKPATGDGGSTTSTEVAAEAPTADFTNNPDYKKGLALIGQSDCLTCHKVAETNIGPSYQDVAARYAGKPGAEDSLAVKIIQGGYGNWGQVPMTAHPDLSEDDAKAMVRYILLLKQ